MSRIASKRNLGDDDKQTEDDENVIDFQEHTCVEKICRQWDGNADSSMSECKPVIFTVLLAILGASHICNDSATLFLRAWKPMSGRELERFVDRPRWFEFRMVSRAGSPTPFLSNTWTPRTAAKRVTTRPGIATSDVSVTFLLFRPGTQDERIQPTCLASSARHLRLKALRKPSLHFRHGRRLHTVPTCGSLGLTSQNLPDELLELRD